MLYLYTYAWNIYHILHYLNMCRKDIMPKSTYTMLLIGPKGKYPLKPQQNGVPWSLSCVVVHVVHSSRDYMYRHTLHSFCSLTCQVKCVCWGCYWLVQVHWSSLRPSQLPLSYVCRTGNITLRCQYESVENVLVVLWSVGSQTTTDPFTIPGHTALPHTTMPTYQEVVVDSYTNLAAGYRCRPTLSNGSQLQSNQYNLQNECECYQTEFTLLCSQLYRCDLLL